MARFIAPEEGAKRLYSFISIVEAKPNLSSFSSLKPPSTILCFEAEQPLPRCQKGGAPKSSRRFHQIVTTICPTCHDDLLNLSRRFVGSERKTARQRCENSDLLIVTKSIFIELTLTIIISKIMKLAICKS